MPLGGFTWAFDDWSPGGDVLQEARQDVGMFVYRSFDADEPHGVPVTFDYEPGPSPHFECVEGGCPLLPSMVIERRGASLILRQPDDALITFNKGLLEVLPDSSGAFHARLIGITINDLDTPPRVSCFPPTGGPYRMEGSLRLTPDAFEDPENAHGELAVTLTDFAGQALTFRF